MPTTNGRAPSEKTLQDSDSMALWHRQNPRGKKRMSGCQG